MLNKSDIKSRAKPAADKPAPAAPPAPRAAPAVDAVQLGQMQAAIGQLATTMNTLARGVAALQPPAPATGMTADVVRDDKGRMTSIRVTINRN